MKRFLASLSHAGRNHFRSVTHFINFVLVIVVLSKEGLSVLHVLHNKDLDSHELLLALAGAADSLHSFIADFMEFFAKGEVEVEEA